MDFNAILRRFFYRNPNRDNVFSFNDEGCGFNDEECGFNDVLKSERRNTNECNDSCEFDEHMRMFCEMRDLFSSMFISSFESITGFSKFDEHFQCEKSPRSFMLKDNEEEHNDACFFKENLREYPILFEEKGEHGRKHNFFSYSKFSSIKTIHLPDGTVEEHRTVIESDGNRVTDIRRTIGDSSHEVITKSDTQGVKEKEENFMNIDESEFANFEQKWNNLLNSNAEEELGPSVGIPQSSPTYWYLIKKFFGSPEGDEIKWC